MLDELFVSSAPFDWDQFLVGEPDRAVGNVSTEKDVDTTPASAILTLPHSPASDTSTPKSTESEQSQALEVADSLGLFDFDFDLPATAGISHDPSDIISSTPAVPDVNMSADPTMLSTFGANLGDFGSLASLGTDAVTQLQLGNILSQLTAPPPSLPATLSGTPGLPEAYAALGWPMSKTSSAAPEPMSTPAPVATAMKRKATDSSDDLSAKRPRGRPPAASTPSAKRPYRRQSKNGMSLSQLAAAAASGSPVVVDEKVPETPAEDGPVRLTSTGKPSTARPKAVVPEKYMKNGEAQAITGMTTEQILSFPNWSALMECVDESHRAGAEVFGKMISENRDKAKWAAKKSRDERKAKVETLEGQVDELNGKIAEMRGVLLSFVGRGLVSLSDVEAYI